MFDRPGIGVDDLAWIHRDQFVHYVQLAHALGDPANWPRFRDDLRRAVTAAFGLDDNAARGLLAVLDEVRRRHDPATDWPGFFDALWSRRHAIRPGLPGRAAARRPATWPWRRRRCASRARAPER